MVVNITSQEKSDLMYSLGQDYLTDKAKNKVFLRENSESYSYTKGKLIGACIALGLSFKETSNGLIIFTTSRKKIIAEINKE